MNIQERLHINHESLLDQYHANVETVLDLQATLLRDILPSIKDELDLSPDATEWAKTWLYDTCTFYPGLAGSRANHTLSESLPNPKSKACELWKKKYLTCSQRNNFTRSFTLEAVRKNLVWRLSNLRSPLEQTTTNFLQCLPSSILDPFDRPVIVLKMMAFNQASDAIKPLVLHVFELLRLNLERLNNDARMNPVLQYVVILDLEGSLLQNLVSRFPRRIKQVPLISNLEYRAGGMDDSRGHPTLSRHAGWR